MPTELRHKRCHFDYVFGSWAYAALDCCLFSSPLRLMNKPQKSLLQLCIEQNYQTIGARTHKKKCIKSQKRISPVMTFSFSFFFFFFLQYEYTIAL
jgi:hypothetical protein